MIKGALLSPARPGLKLCALGQGCPTVRGATPHTAGIAQRTGARSDAKRTGDSKFNLWRSLCRADSRNIVLPQLLPRAACASTAASRLVGELPPSTSPRDAMVAPIAERTSRRPIGGAIKGDIPPRSVHASIQRRMRRSCCWNAERGSPDPPKENPTAQDGLKTAWSSAREDGQFPADSSAGRVNKLAAGKESRPCWASSVRSRTFAILQRGGRGGCEASGQRMRP